jgi:hypothetical protein
MAKIMVTETQLQKIVEQGSNTVAMDLDIYTQPTHFDTDNGNEGVEETIQDIIGKLQELSSMFKSGKKVPSELKSNFHGIFDDINSNFEKVKFED